MKRNSEALYNDSDQLIIKELNRICNNFIKNGSIESWSRGAKKGSLVANYVATGSARVCASSIDETIASELELSNADLVGAYSPEADPETGKIKKQIFITKGLELFLVQDIKRKADTSHSYCDQLIIKELNRICQKFIMNGFIEGWFKDDKKRCLVANYIANASARECASSINETIANELELNNVSLVGAYKSEADPATGKIEKQIWTKGALELFLKQELVIKKAQQAKSFTSDIKSLIGDLLGDIINKLDTYKNGTTISIKENRTSIMENKNKFFSNIFMLLNYMPVLLKDLPKEMSIQSGACALPHGVIKDFLQNYIAKNKLETINNNDPNKEYLEFLVEFINKANHAIEKLNILKEIYLKTWILCSAWVQKENSPISMLPKEIVKETLYHTFKNSSLNNKEKSALIKEIIEIAFESAVSAFTDNRKEVLKYWQNRMESSETKDVPQLQIGADYQSKYIEAQKKLIGAKGIDLMEM